MSNYQLWLKACEENKSLLYNLESFDTEESGLFKVTSEFMVKGHTYYDTAIFILWYEGKQLLVTPDYQLAYRKYEEVKKNEGIKTSASK